MTAKRFTDDISAGQRTYPPSLDPVEERRGIRIIDHLAWLFAHHPNMTARLWADGELVATIHGDRSADPVDENSDEGGDTIATLERMARSCEAAVREFRGLPIDLVESWSMSAADKTPAGQPRPFVGASDMLDQMEKFAAGARIVASALRLRRLKKGDEPK